MIFGTRAVMEAIKAGRDIEKIFIQAGLNNDLAKELITLAKKQRAERSNSLATQGSPGRSSW